MHPRTAVGGSLIRWVSPAPPVRSDALNLLTTTRQQYLLQHFLEALTRGGPNGLPRPIELHAHDPTRYVGDMLAWVHQATASEREFLDALFDVRGHARRMVGEARDMRGEADEEEVLARRCLDRALEGLSRPLKVCRSPVPLCQGKLLNLLSACRVAGPNSAYGQIAGRNHCYLQDCKSGAVLPGDNAADDRGSSVAHKSASRVSVSLALLCPFKVY